MLEHDVQLSILIFLYLSAAYCSLFFVPESSFLAEETPAAFFEYKDAMCASETIFNGCNCSAVFFKEPKFDLSLENVVRELRIHSVNLFLLLFYLLFYFGKYFFYPMRFFFDFCIVTVLGFFCFLINLDINTPKGREIFMQMYEYEYSWIVTKGMQDREMFSCMLMKADKSVVLLIVLVFVGEVFLANFFSRYKPIVIY